MQGTASSTAPNSAERCHVCPHLFHQVEALTKFLFEDPNGLSLIGLDEADRSARLTGAGSSSGAVGVVLKLFRQLVVDDQGEP